MTISQSRFTPELVILTATSRWHYHNHLTGQLSIKTMSNGRAVYHIAGGRKIVVDDSGYLILNDLQPYTIEIDSPAPVTSFCIFFPEGQAADVFQNLVATEDLLLTDPFSASHHPIFFATLMPHDDLVSPAIRQLSQAIWTGPVEAGWVEQRLASLLMQMVSSQQHMFNRSRYLASRRTATRIELQKRLLIARDYMHATFGQSLSLEDIAHVAMLSPYHFLRTFRQLFGQTPHAYLTHLRLKQAQYLLSSTDLPVTEICFALGFTSLGSFSTLFRRIVGQSPQIFRSHHIKTEQDSRSQQGPGKLESA
jgi:AraC-like DNA-binding protein